MIEVLRSNDTIRLSHAMSILEGAGCHPFMADQYTSSVEGSISAIPRRIMVPEQFYDAALEALRDLPD